MPEELTDLATVRKRPGMYVGDADDGKGVLDMLLEIVANAYDLHLAGRCSKIEVVIEADGTIAIHDNGPGLSERGGDGAPALADLLGRLSRRPTADGHRPHVHLGGGAIGMFVVSALSERFEVRSSRDGLELSTAYSRGELVEPLVTVPTTKPNGTRIRFRPDRSLFKHARVPRVELARQLEDLSFLAPGLVLTWSILGDEVAAGGLAARVAFGTPCDLGVVATHTGSYPTSKGLIDVDVALAWRNRWGANSAPVIDSFVNLGRTRMGGSHADAILDGVRAFFGGPREKRTAGLVAAVAIILTDVKYGEPDKSRLDTAEARQPVAEATQTALTAWANAHPELAADIRARIRKSE